MNEMSPDREPVQPERDPRPSAVPPAAGMAPPPYQPPPRPPRRRGRSLLRGLLMLIALVVVLFFVMSLVGGLALGMTGDRIGLVRIEGMISQGEDKEFWVSALRELGENPRVLGVVVRIDSPGGTVGASQEIYQAIENYRARYRKPIYASMGDLAASGGYYVAAASDRIFANAGTLTGSIGVILSKPELSEISQRLGIDVESIKSGRFKDAGSIMRPLDEAETAMFQSLIQDTHRQFIDDILRQRPRDEALAQAAAKLAPQRWQDYGFNIPAEPGAAALLTEAADGRVYTGAQALELGLIDQLGTLEQTIDQLAEVVGMVERPQVIELRRQRGLRSILQSSVGDLLPGLDSPLQYRMLLP